MIMILKKLIIFNEIKDSQYSLNKIEEILDEIDKIA